eukprot:3160241-Pyramimonas_sp.AAC.1
MLQATLQATMLHAIGYERRYKRRCYMLSVTSDVTSNAVTHYRLRAMSQVYPCNIARLFRRGAGRCTTSAVIFSRWTNQTQEVR